MKTRRFAGKKAKRLGSEFEQYIINLGRSQNIKVIRIADGCRQVSADRLLRVKQPFDFVLVSTGEAIFCDTKSTGASNFAYSLIDHNQLDHLIGCSDQGCRSGYLVLFNESKELRFFEAYQLSNLRPGESLKPSEGIDCGTVYTPNIQVLFDRLREITEPLTNHAAL